MLYFISNDNRIQERTPEDSQRRTQKEGREWWEANAETAWHRLLLEDREERSEGAVIHTPFVGKASGLIYAIEMETGIPSPFFQRNVPLLSYQKYLLQRVDKLKLEMPKEHARGCNRACHVIERNHTLGLVRALLKK